MVLWGSVGWTVSLAHHGGGAGDDVRHTCHQPTGLRLRPAHTLPLLVSVSMLLVVLCEMERCMCNP
jgi:hypothetical protein